MNIEKLQLEKTFSQKTLENKWYTYWENQNAFSPQMDSHSKPYCIMLPPPNVTGTLHMGHGFGFSLIDILIRYHHLKGFNTLWQGGTDHAGIATQLVVERQLARDGLHRHDLGREAFVKKVWEWKTISGNTISKQLRRLGASIDWTRERFTLDDSLCDAVKKVFVELYDQGLIYRGKRLVNWDPLLGTAVSDLEVIHHEEEGSLWHIRYPFADHPTEFMVVATTRPETLLGDVAVAVHPDDARYQHHIGHYLKLPCTDRKIPIIADEFVDPTFGTGCVKITPAHDFNDFAMGNRHQLTPINILTKEAKLNDQVPKKYQGLDCIQARKLILSDLSEMDLLEKTEKHTLSVPRGEKTDAIIEPYLTDQWYVRASELAKPAIQAVENGEMKFVPEQWNKTYFQWMNHLEDWCISRQLWWGHRIPVWYDESGNHYSAVDENQVREKYGLSPDVILTQEEDVLDTWFSAALWPFSSLGWPAKTPDFELFFPTQTLITGFDIIFFWVARMAMMSLKFTGKIPFKTIYITGLIRDSEGKKMSKTRGNVLDPLDLIDGIDLPSLIEKRTHAITDKQAEKIRKATAKEFPEGIMAHGTDALRFTFCALASYNRDIRFDMQRLTGNKFFCNKIWNAARFVLMYCEQAEINWDDEKIHSLADAWLQSKLQQLIQNTESALAAFRFDLYAQQLYEFIWNDLCDWYLEWIKPILNQDSPLKKSTLLNLLSVFSTMLQLLHPVMPFITAEIWQALSPYLNQVDFDIYKTTLPHLNPEKINHEALAQFECLQSFITAIRTLRSENKIAPNAKLNYYLRPTDFKSDLSSEKKFIQESESFILQLTKGNRIQFLEDCETQLEEGEMITAAWHGFEMIVFSKIDPKDIQAELEKLKKEFDKKSNDLSALEKKRANPVLIEKKPEIIQETIQKIEKLKVELDVLQRKIHHLDLKI